MDRYEVGNFVCRTAPCESVVALYVTAPSCTAAVDYYQISQSVLEWHGFASQVGFWRLCWRRTDGTEYVDEFEVTHERTW